MGGGLCESIKGGGRRPLREYKRRWAEASASIEGSEHRNPQRTPKGCERRNPQRIRTRVGGLWGVSPQLEVKVKRVYKRV